MALLEQFFEEQPPSQEAKRTTWLTNCPYCNLPVGTEYVVVDDMIITRTVIHSIWNGNQCVGTWSMLEAKPLHPWLYYWTRKWEDIWDKIA